MARPSNRPRFCVLPLCVLVVVTFLTGCISSSQDTVSSASTTPPPTPDESPACATGSLHLIVSTAFGPIAQKAADTYVHDCPGARITVTGCGTR
jgi:ABC-type phosphate transport system substrate-binding protein